MSANLFFDLRARPLDANGAIMPACYYRFFESQTDTPTPVYSDGDLETPLGTSVTALSDGRFPVIYMDSSVVYRVQLYNADDVLQYDADPVHPHVTFPPGTVVMFDGTAEERDAAYPPALWELCDGDNGTKDSRDRMPVGVSATKPISGAGSTGGSTGSVSTSSAGSHDHTGNVSSTVLDANNMPQHFHRLYCWVGNGSDGEHDSASRPGGAGLSGQRKDQSSGGSFGYAQYGNTSDSTDQLVETAGTATPTGHDHDISADGSHTHSVPGVQPPYFTLWFLKRKA